VAKTKEMIAELGLKKDSYTIMQARRRERTPHHAFACFSLTDVLPCCYCARLTCRRWTA
jgi:hypothetical protein